LGGNFVRGNAPNHPVELEANEYISGL